MASIQVVRFGTPGRCASSVQPLQLAAAGTSMGPIITRGPTAGALRGAPTCAQEAADRDIWSWTSGGLATALLQGAVMR